MVKLTVLRTNAAVQLLGNRSAVHERGDFKEERP
jgi:hypothetical protein